MRVDDNASSSERPPFSTYLLGAETTNAHKAGIAVAAAIGGIGRSWRSRS
jgi:hypothetical protein